MVARLNRPRSGRGSVCRSRARPLDELTLTRTYVILVLPKWLLTWGYVKVDVAAFCLQHDDRHGESAGRWRLDLLNTYIRNEPGCECSNYVVLAHFA